MRVMHRITVFVDDRVQEQLVKLGLQSAEGPQTLEVGEDSPVWPNLAALAKEWRATDIVSTRFTDEECISARHLRMLPSWHAGYPMPDENFGYLHETYDLSAYSSRSGIGKKQRGPFRINGEPRWGKRQILQLHWVYDVFFVLPAVWMDVLSRFGIPSMEVLNHKTGRRLESILQLVPQGVAESKLSLEGWPYETCTETGERKYAPHSKGFFPGFTRECSGHYLQTQEYFGSGASAHKAVVISVDLYKQIVARKLRGAEFAPLAE